MKYFFLIVFTVIGSTTLSQTLSDARNYFDNYEYTRAAEILQDQYNTDGLEENDLKRLVYSYYVSGNYIACQPLADTLIAQTEKIDPMFYLISGDANRGIGNYSRAIKSYEKYKSKNGEESVDIKIESCRSIVNWDDQAHVSYDELESNGKMADLSGGLYNGQIIHFKEIGFDKMQDQLGVVKQDNSSFAELLLTQPALYIDNEFINIFMKDSSMASVSSIAFMPNSNKALMTIAYPLSKSALERAPNLYWANLSEENFFSNVEPFEYSGLKDTSSTAHATIHPSGEVIIFTKSSQRTHGADLYKTTLVNGVWTEPVPTESINSDGDEMFPLFQGDSVLSFSSDGRIGYGGLDIYKVNFPFDSPEVEHYKSPINSFKDDFSLTYVTPDSAVFVSNRNNGTGDDDLYHITFRRPGETETPADTFDVNEFISQWKTKNVYFDFDKFTLKNSLSEKNIDALNQFLKECPDCFISLKGFTDSRGSDAYNLKLSKKRAEEVKSMLVKSGFEASTIEVTAKGEKEQPYDCGNDCSEEQHKLNRVVEIGVKQR